VHSKGMIQEPLPTWIVDQSRAVQSIAGTHTVTTADHFFFELDDQVLLTAPCRSFKPSKPLPYKRFAHWLHAQRHSAD
jgi:hypothetical protein